MAIKIRNNKFSQKHVSKLQNSYFKPSTLVTKRNKSRGNYKTQKFSEFLSKIVLPSTMILSVFSLTLIFLPGLFNIKTTAKAAPTKDSVKIITNYTYTTKPTLQKVEK